MAASRSAGWRCRAWLRATASSMASLVPEPMVKWAVWAASPSRTTLPWCQLGQRTGGRVDPVGGDHQVAVREAVQVGQLPLEGELDPDLPAAPLQDLQQPPAGDGREHVPARADGAAAVDHVDGAPAGEAVADLHKARVVGVAQGAQRLLREHHPPAEGGVGGVALDHGDLVARVGPLGQQGEVEARWPAPEHPDAHRWSLLQASTSARRSSWAGSDTVGSSTRWSQPASA